MLTLNKNQRILLASVGIGIAVLQIYIFYDNGIQGASWILSFMVATLLLLPVLSKSTSGANRPKANPSEAMDLLEAQQSIRSIRTEISRLAGALLEDIEQELGLSSAKLPKQFQQAFSDARHLNYVYCLAAIYCVALIIENNKNPSFIGSQRKKALDANIIKLMAESYSNASRLLENASNKPVTEFFNHVTPELIQAERAANEFMRGLREGSKTPDSGLIKYLVTSFGLSDNHDLNEKIPNIQNLVKKYFILYGSFAKEQT